MQQGQKWAANLWVWNGPRNGYWRRNSLTGKNEKPVAQSVSASFESKDVVGAKLYWEDQVTQYPILSASSNRSISKPSVSLWCYVVLCCSCGRS